MTKPNKKKKKKAKLSPDERARRKLQSDHRSMVRGVFRHTGFTRINTLAGKEFTYLGSTTDFDDVCVFENLLVCIEYTTSAPDNVGNHLKEKSIIYNKIDSDPISFCKFYTDVNEELRSNLLQNYAPEEVITKIVYCSRFNFETKHKLNVPVPVYLDYAELRYFKSITDSIRKSTRFELFEFLDVPLNKLGTLGKIGISTTAGSYTGSLLPETNSNLDPGFKVVSFYIDPEALLKRAYVLRKDGWRDSHSVYQRLISKGKIDAIRRYLRKQRRVFVNNIIVTLADDTKIVDDNGNTIDPANILDTRPVNIQIPDRFNTIGLIDGQHRTYSYYESIADDGEIAKLRKKQNLLVTGIIYPPNLATEEKEKFEARLFLEINSNQTNAKSSLKQSIGLVLEPFSAESIAMRVLLALDESTGPLSGQIERYWFDQNKLKTTSIVSYALKPLVKTSGMDSIFYHWKKEDKDKLLRGENYDLLGEYVKFSVGEINKLLSAAKQNLAPDLWTTDKSVSGRMLTTTNINCLLICLRKLIENQKAKGFNYYNQQLRQLKKFQFRNYHSSQYTKMAEAIYEKYFKY